MMNISSALKVGLGLCLGLLLGMTGCTSPATQFMLLIESDLEVSSELSQLQVSVDWRQGESMPSKTARESIVLTSTSPAPDGTHQLPLSIAVVPLPDRLSGSVDFSVAAIQMIGTGTAASSRTLFTRQAKTRFIEGERKLLQMFLAKRCVAEICGEGQTCTENGCVPVTVDASALPKATDTSPRDINLGDIPPSVPEVAFTNLRPRRGDELRCEVTKASIVKGVDNYVPEYTYQWFQKIGSQPWMQIEVADASSGILYAAGASAGLNLKKGEQVKCSVNAKYGELVSGVGEAIVTIQNTLPAIASAQISPETLYANTTTLTASSQDWRDPDGDMMDVRYEWSLRNASGSGRLVELADEKSVLAVDLRAQDTVVLKATPVNGQAEGISVTVEKTVQNTPPTVASVRLYQPGRPNGFGSYFALRSRATPHLQCELEDRKDIDGDQAQDEYRWERKPLGSNVWEVIVSSSTVTLKIADTSITAEDEVRCAVKVNDAQSENNDYQYSNLMKANSRPPAPRVTISPRYPKAGDDLECVVDPVVTEDKDGHNLTLTYGWLRERDGQITLSSDPVVTSTAFAIEGGDRWFCSVWYHDGLELGLRGQDEVSILRNDLIAYWPLDDPNAPGQDVISQLPYNITGGAPVVQTSRAGSRGPNALSIPSEATLKVTRNDLFDRLEQFTVCAWVRPSSSTGSLSSQVILTRWRTIGPIEKQPFNLYLSSERLLYFSVDTPQTFATVGGGLDRLEVPERTWSHVCGRYDGARISSYINGLRYPGPPISGPVGLEVSDGDLYIGGTSYLGHFEGALDDLKLWATALSEDEICFQAGERHCQRMIYSPSAKLMVAQKEVSTALFKRCEEVFDCIPDQRRSFDQESACNYVTSSTPLVADKYPMNCVNEAGAQTTCEFAFTRLPTDLEWQAAASDSGTRTYPWGNESPDCVRANMNDGSGPACGKSSPENYLDYSCQKPSGNSVDGHCDLAGNLQEWTTSTVAGQVSRLFGGHYDSDASALTVNSYEIPTAQTEYAAENGFRCVADVIGSFDNPATSCLEIKRNHPNPTSGWYYLDIRQNRPKKAYCQMRTGLTWLRRTMNNSDNLIFTPKEITASQFKKCIDAGVCTALPPYLFDEAALLNKCNLSVSQAYFDHPMNCVSWEAAEFFCKNWAQARLPTTEEWLAEATDENARIYPWGSPPSVDAPDCANVIMNPSTQPAACGTQRTWPVCSRPNSNSISGLCDMWGNVSEWTNTCSSPNACEIVGGGWEDDLSQRSEVLVEQSPKTRKSASIGFRCVGSAATPPQ